MREGYTISIENGADNYAEIEPLYRAHYAEMKDRLAAIGVPVKPYAPRLDIYFAYFRAGNLLNYIVRRDGDPVGYANVYLTSDMHNGELIAQEDTIFVLPEHRNGTGRHLTKFVLADLKARAVVRFNVVAMTDPRATKLWERLGFKPAGQAMTYLFTGN